MGAGARARARETEVEEEETSWWVESCERPDVAGERFAVGEMKINDSVARN